MSLTLPNFNYTCRTCMNTTISKDEKNIFDFDSNVYKIIGFCTGLKIVKYDGLPSVICGQCVLDLTNAYHFIKTCHKTDATLRQILQAPAPLACLVRSEGDASQSDRPQEAVVCDDEYSVNIHYNSPVSVTLEQNIALDTVHPAKSERCASSKLSPYDVRGGSSEDGADPDLSDHPNIEQIYKVEHRKKYTTQNKGFNGKKHPGKKERPVCATCGLSTVSGSALIVHMRTHSGERPFHCAHCSLSFAQKSTLATHIARRHSSVRPVRHKRFTCEHCGKSYTTSTNLKIHTRTHTGETPYACQLCPSRFTQVGPLLSHVRRHAGQKPHVCSTCGRAFVDRTHLTRHQSVHSEDRPFTCDQCGKCVKSVSALKAHKALHSTEKRHVCHVCGLTFRARGGLLAHSRSVHSERSGQCPLCLKVVPCVEEHVARHAGERNYTCAECGARFAARRGLAVHARTHAPAQFLCAQPQCEQRFRRRWQLESHLRQHAGSFPHVCQVCSKGFLRACHLTKHWRLSHATSDALHLAQNLKSPLSATGET